MILASDRKTHQPVPLMNCKFLGFCAPVAVVALVLMTGLGLHAQPASPASLLRQAYVTLSVADHDYKGHRAEAMKQIEAAAKLLNMNIHGDGKGHERQGVSDEQLRIARGMLEQARPTLSGKVLKHVDKAINQINIALKIR